MGICTVVSFMNINEIENLGISAIGLLIVPTLFILSSICDIESIHLLLAIKSREIPKNCVKTI